MKTYSLITLLAVMSAFHYARTNSYIPVLTGIYTGQPVATGPDGYQDSPRSAGSLLIARISPNYPSNMPVYKPDPTKHYHLLIVGPDRPDYFVMPGLVPLKPLPERKIERK